jgi:hypothetical protein
MDEFGNILPVSQNNTFDDGVLLPEVADPDSPPADNLLLFNQAGTIRIKDEAGNVTDLNNNVFPTIRLTNETNQIVTGGGAGVVTVNIQSDGAPRTYNVPNNNQNQDFVMTRGNQEIYGTKWIEHVIIYEDLVPDVHRGASIGASDNEFEVVWSRYWRGRSARCEEDLQTRLITFLPSVDPLEEIIRVDSTGGFQIPQGTIAQREPAPPDNTDWRGVARYVTNYHMMELYSNIGPDYYQMPLYRYVQLSNPPLTADATLAELNKQNTICFRLKVTSLLVGNPFPDGVVGSHEICCNVMTDGTCSTPYGLVESYPGAWTKSPGDLVTFSSTATLVTITAKRTLINASTTWHSYIQILY